MEISAVPAKDTCRVSSIRHTEIVRKARVELLRMHQQSGVGHIGGNLSVLHILLNLFHEQLNFERDRLVLSKGHAAGALYVGLWSAGFIETAELVTFHKDNTRLSGHPAPNSFAQIPFATGSLGHGLSLASGLALSKKLKNAAGHCYCVTSDGEWNEGSMWEGLIFANHHDLTNLTVVIDRNGLQGFGSTDEVANLAPLANKFRAFELEVVEIDGHDWQQLSASLSTRSKRGPKIIIANTIKGCGVSFMENKMEWHYLPLNAEQLELALAEVGGDK